MTILNKLRDILLWLLMLLALIHAEITDSSELVDPDVENQKLEGSLYLHNVMEKLQSDRELGQSVEVLQLTNLLNLDRVSEPSITDYPARKPLTGVIAGPTPNPPIFQADVHPLSPSSPSLTSNELNAIYNAALKKGTPLSFRVPHNNDQVVEPASQGQSSSLPGYYYYYYPIKSFLPAGQNQIAPFPRPAPIQASITMNDASSNKSMEPLFMAVTGFIGMALMFIASVLFLPKFNNLRSGEEIELKRAPDELAAFGRLVIETLDGKDCTDRIACELGRAVRQMKLEKMLKVLEIVLPPNMARQIGLIRKAVVKKDKCNFISCVFKTSRPAKNQSAHDLWMKHFEKKKDRKKINNIWDKAR